MAARCHRDVAARSPKTASSVFANTDEEVAGSRTAAANRPSPLPGQDLAVPSIHLAESGEERANPHVHAARHERAGAQECEGQAGIFHLFGPHPRPDARSMLAEGRHAAGLHT